MLNASGIYEILNTVNGKRYIGQASKFAKRFAEHRQALKRGDHHSRHLQAAWDKYGNEAFIFLPLLICKCERDVLQMYEQRCFDVLKPEYNIALISGSTLGIKRSPETRKKISMSAKGHKRWLGKTHTLEAREKISAKAKGRIISDETRASISRSLLGNKRGVGVKKSAETLAKLKAAATGRKYPPEFGAAISARQVGNTFALGNKHSEEARAKMSAVQTGNTKGHGNLGSKRSPEQCANIGAGVRAAWLRKKEKQSC